MYRYHIEVSVLLEEPVEVGVMEAAIADAVLDLFPEVAVGIRSEVVKDEDLVS